MVTKEAQGATEAEVAQGATEAEVATEAAKQVVSQPCDLAHFRHHLRTVRWIEAQRLDDWEHVLAVEYLRDSYDAIGVPADARGFLVRAHACVLLAVKVDGVWPFPDIVFGVKYGRPETWGGVAKPLEPTLRDDEVAAAERTLFKSMRHSLLRDTMGPDSPSFAWYCMLLRMPPRMGSAAVLRRAAVDLRRRRIPATTSADWVARVLGAADDLDAPSVPFLRVCLPWLTPGADVEYLGVDAYVRASVDVVEFDGRTFWAGVWMDDGGAPRLRWTMAERLRQASFWSDSRALRLLDREREPHRRAGHDD